MTAAEKDEPMAGEYTALLAILEKLGHAAPPIPLWNLNGAGLTAARLKGEVHALAVCGCIRASYKAGLPDEVVEVRAEAGRLAAAWTAGRSGVRISRGVWSWCGELAGYS